MPLHDARNWLWDVRESCGLIAEATRRMSFNEFVADRLRRSAVERELEIIATALKNAVTAEPGLEARFPEMRGIIDFRNILAHGYHMVKYEKVWPIIEHHVPALRTKVDQILSERPPPGK
jgi:uncharacterized protein with HEPN domain